MEQLIRRRSRGTPRLVGRPEGPHPEPRPEQNEIEPLGVDARAARTGLLGEPLRGDETSGLGAAAPDQTVAGDYDAPPAERRIGEGLRADGINFQSRPSATESAGYGDQGSGGGSGL